MSTITNWFKSLAGAFGEGYTAGTSASVPTTFGSAEEMVGSAFDIVAQFTKPAADGMASTATTNTAGNDVNSVGGGFTNIYPYDLEVVGFAISPNATLTADANNNATISILTDDGANGTPGAVFALQTAVAAPGSGNWAVNTQQLVTKATATAGTKGTYTAANARLRPGARLFIAIAKSGTGVVVPICIVHVLLRRR